MIGIYDNNNEESGLKDFYNECVKKGIGMYRSEKLESLQSFEKVIINPICILCEGHWREIGNYINKNPQQQIFFFAPHNTKGEIKKFIGEPKNVEYIATKEQVLEGKTKLKELYSLIGVEK